MHIRDGGSLIRRVGVFFWHIAENLWHFNARYETYPVLKLLIPILTHPLMDGFIDVANACYDLSGAYDVIADYVAYWLEENPIDRWFFLWIVGGRMFINDPGTWAIDRINDKFPGFRNFIEDPMGTIEDWILDRLAGIRELVEEGSAWVFRQICEWWPDFYWFVQDPSTMVVYWVEDAVPWLEGFFWTPRLWLQDTISDMLELPVSFWDSPRDWVLKQFLTEIAERREDVASWIRSFGESVLRFMYEGVW